MSKLIDIFERAAEGPYQPMGFRTNNTESSTPKLVLIAGVKGTVNASSLEGAHAAIVMPGDTMLNGKDIQSLSDIFGEMPWGLADGSIRASKLPKGCDFILFPALTAVGSIPEDEELGRVLQIEASMDDGLLRAVNDLPIDAVVAGDSLEESTELNWHRLMIIKHVVNILSAPVIVPVNPGITGAELKALRNAGVSGVMADATDAAPGSIGEIRKLIDELPAKPAPKKNNHAEALLPRTTGYREPEPEPDEEDDDWE